MNQSFFFYTFVRIVEPFVTETHFLLTGGTVEGNNETIERRKVEKNKGMKKKE